MTTQNKNLRIAFIAAICFVFIISIFSYTKINSFIESAALVNNTTQAKLELEKIIGSLQDAETGQRGYLLTHDKTFLEPFIKGLKEYPQNIKNVKQLIIDKPDQQKSVTTVEQLAQNREGYMRKMLEVDKLRRPTNTELLIGKSIMDSLRTEINIMIAREDSLKQHRTNQLHNQTMIAPAMLLILSLMALAILIISYWQLNKSLVQAQLLKAEAIQQAVQFEKTKEIRDSEKQYNMMLMKSPFCFGVIKGTDMIITFANTAIKEVWGKGNDIEDKPLLEILPELINTTFPSLIQNVMTTGLPYYSYEMLAQLDKNGKLEDGYFNFVYQPYYESEETISGVTIIAIEVTKEAKAKKQLEKSEMRFRNMVEQAPVAISVLRGENFAVEVANEKQLELFGKTKEQVLNLPLFTAVPESTGQGFEELLSGVYTTGKPFFANEIPLMLTRNGKKETFYSNFISEPLYNDEHKIDGIVSIVTDVTEQVITRKKIEESEQVLQKIKDQLDLSITAGKIGVWHWDVKNDVLYWSKEQKAIYGLEPTAELLNVAQYRAFVIPEDWERLNRDLQSAPMAEEQEYDFRIIRKNDGAIRWVKSRARNILDENGGLKFISGVNIDISEQVIALNKIQESEERFRTLAQTLPQLVWVSDANGNPEFASSRWREYTGIEPGGEEEWKAIVHPEDYEGIAAAWLHSKTTGSIYKHEVRLRSKEGIYRWYAGIGEAVLDEQKNIVKWVGAFTDIHEQKIREEKKDEFISIASHEMKTPLTTAKAYLQMLELSLNKNDEDSNLFVKKASQSVNRLNELVGELLDASKIRLGKLNYTITTFNFNEMIESTVENVQLTSTTHVIIKTGKVNNEVTGDKDRLQQVVINLLNNAVKYSPGAEKVFITIEQEKETIKVSVKDTGIGMSRQSLHKIFEKYHRIEEHAVHFQGLGIGLFISYEIVERHHGKLWAESEPGKGSTFYFTIPINITSPQ